MIKPFKEDERDIPSAIDTIMQSAYLNNLNIPTIDLTKLTKRERFNFSTNQIIGKKGYYLHESDWGDVKVKLK